jgi:alpha-mannosidase
MSRYGASSLVQDFTMYPDRDQLDVAVTVNWQEQAKLLKFRFPVYVEFMRVTHEVAYGHNELKANGEESPFQSWVDLSGMSRRTQTAYGFSLLNDAKHSLDVKVREIGMTVVRSPAYAHHIPAQVDPAKNPSYIDQGIQRFNYAMLPHAGSWEQAGTVHRAAELNHPPVSLRATFHPNGALPQSDGFIDVQPSTVVVTVLKQAEDNDDLIVRAYETTKTATKAAITLPKWNRVITADFVPCEIKTFRIPRDASKPVTEVNLLEWVD